MPVGVIIQDLFTVIDIIWMTLTFFNLLFNFHSTYFNEKLPKLWIASEKWYQKYISRKLNQISSITWSSISFFVFYERLLTVLMTAWSVKYIVWDILFTYGFGTAFLRSWKHIIGLWSSAEVWRPSARSSKRYLRRILFLNIIQECRLKLIKTFAP